MKEYEEYLNKLKERKKITLQEVLYDFEDKLANNTIYHIFELDNDWIKYKIDNGNIIQDKWIVTEEEFEKILKKLL